MYMYLMYFSTTNIEDVLQTFSGVALLRVEFGDLEVGSPQSVLPSGQVPHVPGHLHQTVAHEEHHEKQTPRVAGCRHQGFDALSAKHSHFQKAYLKKVKIQNNQIFCFTM